MNMLMKFDKNYKLQIKNKQNKPTNSNDAYFICPNSCSCYCYCAIIPQDQIGISHRNGQHQSQITTSNVTTAGPASASGSALISKNNINLEKIKHYHFSKNTILFF
jgi:hypothetical protein